jgi:hypothetical protein
MAAGYSAQLLGGASVATSIGWFGGTNPSLAWTSRGLARVVSSADSSVVIVYNDGYGGSVVPLSWEYASEVANLVAMAWISAGTSLPRGPLAI